MFGLASFKNKELTLYLACVWVCKLKNKELTSYFALVTLHLALLGWDTLRSLQIAYRSTVYFSTGTIGTNGTNGTNRQVVSARLSSVNICSLQMEHRSASFFSIGTIGSNSTNRQMVYAWPSCVNMCSSQMFTNGIPMD